MCAQDPVRHLVSFGICTAYNADNIFINLNPNHGRALLIGHSKSHIICSKQTMPARIIVKVRTGEKPKDK